MRDILWICTSSVKLFGSSLGFARARRASSCSCRAFYLYEIVLRIFSFSSFEVSAEDFKKQGEPIVVQGAHNREENCVQCDIGLEMLEFRRVPALGDEEVYHLRQSVDASGKPENHANHEGNSTGILVYRSI